MTLTRESFLYNFYELFYIYIAIIIIISTTLFTSANMSKVKSFQFFIGKLFLYPVYSREVMIKKFEIQGVGVVREKILSSW